MANKTLLKSLLAEQSKVPRHKLQKVVSDKARKALEADCKRQFNAPYEVVLRRANRALRLAESGEMPDNDDMDMAVFLAEREKIFELASDKLGVTIEV